MSALARLLGCSAVVLMGCEGTSPAPVPDPPPPVSLPISIAISPTGRTIAAGDSLQFSVSTNHLIEITEWTWSVTPMNAATVNSSGLVKALSAGKAIVAVCTKIYPTACGMTTLSIY